MLIRLTGDAPAFHEIHAQLRSAVLEGRLRPGTRLPASRRLARELGVARITVVQAYDQLIAEGYLEARRGAGTWVATDLHDVIDRRPRPGDGPAPRLSAYAARAAAAAPAGKPLSAPAPRWDFQYGHPEVPGQLSADWRRAARRAARARPTGYPDPQGEPGLRECLAAYLRDHRGILADPRRIMVVGGTQQALELIGRCALDPGDGVVLEEPHYQGARHAFRALGARLEPIPVDGDGLRTDDLPRTSAQGTAAPKLAYVTPSHQFPLGGVLPAARRLALLEWAQERGAFVIEDDYDSEYRHAGPPLQTLHALDRSGRVLYVGTLSKVLFPGLRLGYIVLPPAWVEPMRHMKWLADRGTSAQEQLALTELFRTGAFRRHSDTAARRLAHRRHVLVRALERRFGERLEILGTHTGMHISVRSGGHTGRASRRLVEAARRRGAGVYTTDAYYAGTPPDHLELLLGYAAVAPAAIRAGIKQLRHAMDETGIA